MALTRARVVSASPAFRKRVEDVIAGILQRPRDAKLTAGDVVEMRTAIAKEKGDSARWDLKYVAGGLIDIEFIAQYLQLVHAHRLPDILDTSTARVLDKARALERLGGGGCGSPSSCGSTLSRSDADPALVLYRTRSIQKWLGQAFYGFLRGPATCRILRRLKRRWPIRRERCARASFGFWGRIRWWIRPLLRAEAGIAARAASAP